jgi:hypothetical protein
VIKNLSNGKSYGYLLDGSATKSLQVDMSGVLAAPMIAASAARELTTDPTTNGLVKSIVWAAVNPVNPSNPGAFKPALSQRSRAQRAVQ